MDAIQKAYEDAVTELLEPHRNKSLVLRMIRESDGEVFEVARVSLDDWSVRDRFQLVVVPNDDA